MRTSGISGFPFEPRQLLVVTELHLMPSHTIQNLASTEPNPAHQSELN